MKKNIWKIKNNVVDYASVIFDSDSVYENLPYFEGYSIKEQWPLGLHGKYCPLGDSEKRALPISNFGYMVTGMFTCDDKVRNSRIIEEANVEFLPIFIADKIIWAVNVLEIIDCLHEEKSEIERFRASGRVKRVKEYAFKETMINPSSLIFKIPQMIRTEIYATDQFKEKIELFGFTGLRFDMIYSFK